MTREDGIKLLEKTKIQKKPSAINRMLSHEHMVKTILDALNGMEPKSTLSPLMEKRVWQAHKNQKNPKGVVNKDE